MPFVAVIAACVVVALGINSYRIDGMIVTDGSIPEFAEVNGKCFKGFGHTSCTRQEEWSTWNSEAFHWSSDIKEGSTVSF